MSIKGIMRFFFFLSLLIMLMGCGRKAPPTLPEKPSSRILKLETGNSIYKEAYLYNTRSLPDFHNLQVSSFKSQNKRRMH